jgi:hypothetical protein
MSKIFNKFHFDVNPHQLELQISRYLKDGFVISGDKMPDNSKFDSTVFISSPLGGVVFWTIHSLPEPILGSWIITKPTE